MQVELERRKYGLPDGLNFSREVRLSRPLSRMDLATAKTPLG
jgi:hypothetical protein